MMFRLACSLLLVAILSGCAATQSRTILAQQGDLPDRAAVADVPFYPQEDYYCGPASLAMSLNWAGIPVSQEEAAQHVYTPGRQGTLTTDLLAGARRNGALAVPVNSLEDLLAEIAAGHPVLVFQNLSLNLFPRWHFAVAVEYDLAREEIVLRSGTDERRVTNINAFERTWARTDYWAITVTPPHRLPARADVNAVLAGAAGLERAEQLTAATQTYSEIIRRWPDNMIAHFGLGNSLYAQSDYVQAATAYRQALEIDPDNPYVWNNLAHALVKSGKREEAAVAAQRAVTLGRGADETFQKTLEEITSAEVSEG